MIEVDPAVETKRCYKCGADKPRADFYRDKRSRDGLKFECRPCFYAMSRAWQKKNPEKLREIAQRSRAKHYDRHIAGCRANYQAHREERYAYHVRWREEHPERWRDLQRTAQRAYKARKRGAEGKHSPEDIKRIYAAQQGRCAICRDHVGDDYHVDHIMPLAGGGTNWPNNLQVLCPACNHSKKDKDPIEHMRSLGRLL